MSTKDEYFIDGRGMTAEEHDEELQRAQRDRAPKANVRAGFGGGGDVGGAPKVTMVSSSVLAGVQLERDHARHDAETWSARAVEAEAQLDSYRAAARAHVALVAGLREKLVTQAVNHGKELAALQAQIDRSDAIVTERDEQLEAMVKALTRSDRELAVAVSFLTKRDAEEVPPVKERADLADICGCGRSRGSGVHARWAINGHAFVARRDA